jgi:hypothetical protein
VVDDWILVVDGTKALTPEEAATKATADDVNFMMMIFIGVGWLLM